MRKPTAKTVEDVNIYLEGFTLLLPDTSTDNAVARFDGTTGALQDSSVTVSDTGKVTLGDAGSTAGLEFGANGPRIMVGTGGPSGISAPVGSTWRQTDANATYGNLTGLLWTKVGTGTAEGTDWLVDFEGRWVSYTPTQTNLTGGTATGSYTRTGKVVHFKVNYVAGTVGTNPRLGLPTSMPGSKRRPCSGHLADTGTNNYGCLAMMYDNYVEFYYLGTSGVATSITASAPFTWTTNDEINATGTYEIA